MNQSATKHKRRFRYWRWMALLFIASVVGSLFVSWWVAGRLLAPANRVVSKPSDIRFAEFKIQSQSGSEISGWEIEGESDSAVIILLHPIRGSRLSMLGRARMLNAAGYSVVLIDLQAHGESPGTKITLGFLEKHDVHAVVQYVKSEFTDRKIGIIGWSLGGAAALLASPLEVDAIVLESVYPTVEQAVNNRVEMRLGVGKLIAAPLLLAQLPIRLGISASDLRPIDKIKQVGCPILLLAGDQDQHTTIQETQAMFDAAIEPKNLIIFENAAHVDLLHFESEKYHSCVLEFLRKAFVAKP